MHSIIKIILISSLLLYGIVASSSESIHFALRDSVGNLIKTIDTSNKVVSSYRYTPYGLSSSAIPQVEESEFTGQTCSSVTGLCDFSHRHYDPVTARFLTPDPEHEFSSPYSYTSRPKTFTDPSGLWFEDIEGVIASVRLHYLKNGGTPNEPLFDNLRVRLEEAKKEYDVARRKAQSALIQVSKQDRLLRSQGAVSDEESSASPTAFSGDELVTGAVGESKGDFLGFSHEQREHLINTYYVDRKFQDPYPPLFYSNRALDATDLVNISLIKARFWDMSREEAASAGQAVNCMEAARCVIDYLKTGIVREARPGMVGGFNTKSEDERRSSYYNTDWWNSSKMRVALDTSEKIEDFAKLMRSGTFSYSTVKHNNTSINHAFITYKDAIGAVRVFDPEYANFFAKADRTPLQYIRLHPEFISNFMVVYGNVE